MAATSIERLVSDAAEQCGWDSDTVVTVLEQFIDEFCDPDEFRSYLERRVADDRENDLLDEADGDVERDDWS
jgi:hypothetical protein